ncbi:MAG: hemolysin III family protein [Clostridia bacterium]|nr:hemolysin III family protein [Clostridia bacterium]
MKNQRNKPPIHYAVGEDIGNAVTHGIGAALAVAGLVLLIVKSIDAWQVVSSCIYGSSLFILFLMSCLYHAIRHKGARRVMRVFDHTGIFFLIAGTYTPYTLVSMRGVVGWVLFGVVWAAAIVGIVLNSISIERFKTFSMICYIASGWCVVAAIVPLIQAVPTEGLLLLLGGGVLYTVGILFYRQKTKRWFHMVWHLFVLAAAVLQFFGIYLYVIG